MPFYNIIEVANTHGGSMEYMLSLVDEFADVEGPRAGMKFQPFHYDYIALKDFEHYPTYQKLHFTEENWEIIIKKATATKDVWLDLFDVYGTKILEANIDRVYGIKLQTSVLHNQEVLSALEKIDLSKKQLIINIAGRSQDEIRQFVTYFETVIKPQELLLEVGFQAYPTELMDSGLGKIGALKKAFAKRIVFADHIDGTHADALRVPVIAMIAGADVIEKHVMHSSLETKFDKFSSITKDQFNTIIAEQKKYTEAFDQEFINDREKNYLKKSIQVPVLNTDKKAGETLLGSDLCFRRTSQKGVDFNALKNKLNGKYVFTNAVSKYHTLQESDLRKLKIATIIAARLKSSRLKEKAKLKIGELSSVELCIKNALRFKDVDYTILATSTNEQDDDLKNYTYSKDVIFHKGDPEDVIQRYLDIARKLHVDIVIRVTGDNPFISADVAEFLIASHLRSGADYTAGKVAPIGANLELMNVSALEKIKKHFARADYSEYMTWYFTNNPEHFKLNFVDLPEKWVRNYRLTLDYQEDLDMFNKIEDHLNANQLDYSLDALIDFLDANPDVANMNSHIGLKFRTDPELIATLNKMTRISEAP